MRDLVVKGGTLVDPSQGINEKKDIAINGGKIEDLSASISGGNSRKIIDATGMIVTPGLVDLHAHVANDVIRLSIDPERNCLMKGTTTVVDAGSCGELNFTPFKQFVIQESKIRILAFLNIESLGMIEFYDSKSKNNEQAWPELLTEEDELYSSMFVNLVSTTRTIRKNRKLIVGIKWAHHGLKILGLARKAADEIGCRIMAESRYMPETLKYLKKGDIATHAFHFARHQITCRRDGIMEDGKKIHPEVFAAVKRGIVFDVGHGKGSFSWAVASLALKEGLEPDTISTDLWVGNVNGPVIDLPTTMAKFLYLGLGLEKVVEATTSKPASVLGLQGKIGSLKVGADADICVFKLRKEKVRLTDSYGKSVVANKKLVPVQVIRSGQIVKGS